MGDIGILIAGVILAVVIFIIYFIYKQIEYFLVSVKLYKKMVVLQERIADAVEVIANIPRQPHNSDISDIYGDSPVWKKRIVATEIDVNNLPKELMINCGGCERLIGVDYPYCPYCVKKNKNVKYGVRPDELNKYKPKF